MSENLSMSYEIVESLLRKQAYEKNIEVTPESLSPHLKIIAEDLFVPYNDKSILYTAKDLLKYPDKFLYFEHHENEFMLKKDKFEYGFEQSASINARENHAYFTENMTIKRIFRKYSDELGDKSKRYFLELYKNTKEKGGKRGVFLKPSSLVAGCVYDTCIKNNIPLTQKKLSEMMFISESTVRTSITRVRRINSEEKIIQNQKPSYQTLETSYLDTKNIGFIDEMKGASDFMAASLVAYLNNPLIIWKKPGNFGKKPFWEKVSEKLNL